MAPAGRVSRHFGKGDIMAKARRLGAASPRPTTKKSRFANSDIPYKDRLTMQRLNTIAQHRDDAARIALKIATVALNDTEGLGYTRLCRFAVHLQKLLEEYYADPEYQEVKLNQRLQSMGFLVENGRVYCASDDNGNIVPTKELMGNG